MSSFAKAMRRGDPMIWLTGSALGMCMLMIAGLLLVILMNGLSFFWPKTLTQVKLKDGTVVLGEVVGREPIPNPGHPDHLTAHRTQFRLGNRDLSGNDFRWVNDADVTSREEPKEAFFVERREYGPFIGTPVLVKEGDKKLAEGPAAVEALLPDLVSRAHGDRAAVERIEKGEIGDINYAIEKARLEGRRLDRKSVV